MSAGLKKGHCATCSLKEKNAYIYLFFNILLYDLRVQTLIDRLFINFLWQAAFALVYSKSENSIKG